ncbi:hypothetical protein QR90_08445 [Deinococcus radiopugnans]|uniref:Uncharacterized protein n=1 Tax=Deinococcus radiopugnans TaxID=57497 RepID=A0A0A7KG23_9DEIO|nr:hypothetical protein [Deinococcus radiopugnans]AIZ45127.1 hypothetical protein QR90_08445 [Deinococcus radiopugnans]
MTGIQTWLDRQTRHTAPLLATEADGLTVQTHLQGRERKRLTLTRHPDFDAIMIDMVEAGLQDPAWQGFVYVMFTGPEDHLVPRYIGKAERRGVRNTLSANLARIRTNMDKFGRWGYNSAYHLGELSHAVLAGAFKPGPPKRNYTRWRDALFVSSHPPVLRTPVCVHLLPWRCGMRGPSGLVGSVAAVEYELIALAGAAYPAELLNTRGR